MPRLHPASVEEADGVMVERGESVLAVVYGGRRIRYP